MVVCMGGRAIFMRERNDGMRWRLSAALTKTSLFLPDARISVLWPAWNVQELPRREGERQGSKGGSRMDLAQVRESG